MANLIFVPLTLTTLLSAYTLNLAYTNITLLQRYERQSEKAAEWSSIAAERLRKTRTTQASGAVSIVLSLISSTYLILHPILSSEKKQSDHAVLITAVNIVASSAARVHMAGFWNEKEQTRVPFLEKFNDAVRGSERERDLVWGIAGCWVAVGLFAFW
ncbi:hypothetical protein BU24DRAFT_360858 [Aaosphaeria arxii CBS 175.79]|uniref:DUF1772-domain-containing protein n=1 Tax=Aaosphaeria arxii CBS 175.79 TaxID=1450172 RepID=A0A6A5Y4H3_9PLEO|nr:uncharacterized protein BU24DRAFT_360858 [Aaosphaeria arxii CBS 175.79]KAF2020398.1 hypothetical protein BU24DRAFT_360858 [Aaosphaeria arxii CBS 175.79]